MWKPSSRRSGKTSTLQPFSKQEVHKWREHTERQPEKVVALLVAVWSAKTSHAQLASLKRLNGSLSQLVESGSLSPSVLLVLVEMYAVCISRHPLQRAIASLLQSLPEPHSVVVTGHVHSTIESALSTGWLPGHSQELQFLEALEENFALGELALWKQLPLAIEYCISVIESCHTENKLTDPLFLTALKTSMSLLNKTQSVVHNLLSGVPTFHFNSANTDVTITWPGKHGGQSTEFKVQWVRGLFERATDVCEEILMTGCGVPHDVTVTAAMLHVVIILRTSSVDNNLDRRINTITTNWLVRIGAPLSTFPRLSVCHALLAKLTPSALLMDTGGKPCLLVLFPVICLLFDGFTETSERYIAARTLALWTSVAKQCAGIVAEGDDMFEALLPSGHVISSVLQYVWALWEDPIDGIRHQCKLMFENVIGICQHLQREGPSPSPFLLSLADSLLSLSSPSRGKYQLLSTLSHHLPITTLLLTTPTLPTELLSVMGHQALACHAGELWSRLVQLHWDEEKGSLTVWTKTWVDTVVCFMMSASPLSRRHTIQHCLPSLFECCLDCMELIRTCLREANSATADAVLTTELACLCCAKSHLKSFTWEESHETTFIAATHHRDEQMQLSALGVLCESHRSTEPPAPSSLPLLLTFLSLNGCTQSPNFRYPMITAIKKLLVRIRDSSYAMRKLHSKKRGPDPHSTVILYQEFLQSLLSQQLGSLHPFSSYQRRHTALSLLQLMSTIFPSQSTSTISQLSNHSNDNTTRYSNSSAPFIDDNGTGERVISPVFEFPSAVSVDQARRLVYCLRDSYDANRALVLEILCHLSRDTVGLLEAGFPRYLTTTFHQLMVSPKAVDCTTASYILRLLLRANCTELNHLLQDHITATHEPQSWCSSVYALDTPVDGALPPQWVTVYLLVHILRYQLEAAQRDLLTASVQSPMYGVMQSIRATLEETKGMSCDMEVCQTAVSEVIQLCEEVASVASPVVCNSSPEGFLPGTKGLPASNSAVVSSECGASAQSLLLCCWHAMKETSLIMGLVVEWAPIGNNLDSLLSRKQVDSIASVFIHQLTEARHRGAFEMAYTGFQKLCHSLWNSTCQEFQLMPSQWVQELVDSLQSKSMTRLLSITRRSAGLPFYLQAILTSEPSHTGRPCLKRVMSALLSVASTWQQPDMLAIDSLSISLTVGSPDDAQSEAVSEEGSTEHTTGSDGSCDAIQPHSAAVHALNILRALYRDSRLGEHVTPFVPEGVEIAVRGFSASLWPVRNSSTLLFSALVLRVFGAKRVQDEHSVENKLTAREFFTRFPSLHSFLHRQLQRAATELRATRGLKSLQLSLFPVLLILSRLYPTALDDASSLTSLNSFLPLLLQCASCTVWKTRVLISRTLVPLINPHNAQTVLESVLLMMNTCNQNSLHTALLTLHRLVLDRRELLDVMVCNEKLGVWLLDNLLKRQTLGSKANLCGVTRCAYLELLTSLLDQQTRTAALNVFQEARQCLLDSMIGESAPMLEDVLVSSCKFLFTCTSQFTKSTNTIPQTMDLCSECLRHDSVAVRQYTLQFILSSSDLLADNGLTSQLVKLFSTEQDESVLTLLCSVLIKAVEKQRCEMEMELYTAAFQHATKTHLRLELRSSLILFLSSLMGNAYVHELVVRWLLLVEQYTHPTAPVELRQAVAVGLGKLWRTLLQVESPHIVERYCMLVVCLLQDGAEEVRDDMASSVGTILSSLAPVVETLPDVSTHPSASSALRSYITSLPLLLHCCPHTTLSVLLQLVDLDESLAKKSDGTNNLLFEEDPLNNYMEEISVLTAACRALKTLLSNHCEELCEPLISLVQKVQSIGTFLLAEVTSSDDNINSRMVGKFSPWDQRQVFLGLCKVALLSQAIVDGASERLPALDLVEPLTKYTELKTELLISVE